jgi:signal transduction histidine kinase
MNELILVVDDAPQIVKQARDYLERGGFRVTAAGDGKTALAMARQLVRAHGGDIAVESAVGQGTTFTLTLPADEK